MRGETVTGAHGDRPAYRYRICVRGRLGETIRSAFPALQAQASGGDTVLTGPLPDRAALYGVLAQIEALGLELTRSPPPATGLTPPPWATGRPVAASADRRSAGRGSRPPAHACRQPGRVAWPCSGEGASRPRARARATASARVCVPSLAYRWVMWVLTVLCETYSSPAISGPDRLVGR